MIFLTIFLAVVCIILAVMCYNLSKTLLAERAERLKLEDRFEDELKTFAAEIAQMALRVQTEIVGECPTKH